MDNFEPRNQRPYYSITFKIGDDDYSSNLTDITMVNSMNFCYPSLFIGMKIDSKEYFTKKLNGMKAGEITIVLTDVDMTPLETSIFEVVLWPLIVPLSPKTNDTSPTNPESDYASFVGIPQDPFAIAIKKITGVYTNMTPLDIIKQIISEYFPQLQTNILDAGANTKKIPQVSFSKYSFNRAIKYLDEKHGIFTGPSFHYFFPDKNKKTVFGQWSLNKSVSGSEDYNVVFLAKGSNDAQQIEQADTDAEHFYTYSELKTSQRNNQQIMKHAFNHTYIAKPLDSLYSVLKRDMKQTFHENSLIDGNNADMNINPILQNTEIAHARGYTGDGINDVKANLSKYLTSMSKFSFELDTDLTLERLAYAGLTVNLKPMVTEFATYGGKYITVSSIMQFTRNTTTNYQCTASVTCTRSNLEI